VFANNLGFFWFIWIVTSTREIPVCSAEDETLVCLSILLTHHDVDDGIDAGRRVNQKQTKYIPVTVPIRHQLQDRNREMEEEESSENYEDHP